MTNGAIIAWGDPGSGSLNIPGGLTNVTAVAAGSWFSMALKNDGTVTGWGNFWSEPPAGTSNLVAIAAAGFSLGLKSNGTVVAWGGVMWEGPAAPVGLTNVRAIAAGANHGLALTAERKVTAWGRAGEGQIAVPAGLTNVVAIAAGDFFSLALKDDGTLVGWGQIGLPPLSNIVAIAAGTYHAFALLQDGTLVGLGQNGSGQLDMPAGLSNVVSMSAGGFHSTALRSDGTVAAWGSGDTAPPGLSNVVQTSSGFTFDLALLKDGPAIVRQPADRVIFSGMDAVLTVGAAGADLRYQWRFNGTNIVGATQPLVSLTNVQPANSGLYSVIVTNATRALLSSNATLTVVTSPPIMTTQSVNQLVPPGGAVTIGAGFIGSRPLAYQWQLNGSNILFATNATLALTDLQDRDSGRYTLVASNAYGVVTNSGTFVTVNDLPSALNAPELVWTNAGDVAWFCQTNTSHDGVASAQSAGLTNNSQSARLQTTVTGPGTLNFWCMDNTANGEEFLGFAIDDVQQFYLPLFTPGWQQKRFYLAEGQHRLEWSFYSPFYVDSRDWAWVDEVRYIPGPTPATITSAPTNLTVAAGENATFTVSAVGTPVLNYQWQFEGSDLPGATNASLTISNAQASGAGLYSVVVTNSYGVVVSNASLNVLATAPTITAQPKGGRFIVGSQKTLSVTAKGSERLSYQWRFNGNDIAGATNSSLAFANLQESDSGTYAIALSNVAGVIVSSNAVLAISHALVLVWGDNRVGQTNVPLALTNPLSVAAGSVHVVALRTDGTLLCWGVNQYGQTNIPAGLTNVVAVDAGAYHSLAIKDDGSVGAWGAGTNSSGGTVHFGQSRVPVTLSNVTAVSAGIYHSLALRRDGVPFAWGQNFYGQTNIPPGATDLVAIGAGGYHNLGLRANGAVIAWGAGTNFSAGLNGYGQSLIPPGLSNVVAVAGGLYHSMALTADGKVVAWGNNQFFQTNVPPGLSNVVAIAAGDFHCVALKRDGSLVLWGAGTSPSFFPPHLGQSLSPAGISNFVIASAGALSSAGIVNDRSPFFATQPLNRTVFSGDTVAFSVRLASPLQVACQWRFNDADIPGATGETLIITNAPLGSAGNYQCIASNAVGVTASRLANLVVLRSTPRFNTSAGSFGLTTNGFDLSLSGLSGHGSLVIYFSIDLNNWHPFVTNSPVLGNLNVRDTDATNSPLRFYRAVEQ